MTARQYKFHLVVVVIPMDVQYRRNDAFLHALKLPQHQTNAPQSQKPRHLHCCSQLYSKDFYTMSVVLYCHIVCSVLVVRSGCIGLLCIPMVSLPPLDEDLYRHCGLHVESCVFKNLAGVSISIDNLLML